MSETQMESRTVLSEPRALGNYFIYWTQGQCFGPFLLDQGQNVKVAGSGHLI